ncbi:MAG: DUF4838 domain-containing protein [Oscillospiraceae bacterium]|nr:DUF4838 domain-containing protein [Oscillospiraceae bacterium]
MLKIKLLRAENVLFFAAEELKKYLRMMMPRCGEIGITFEPGATDGFRLGLLEDFGIPSEAADPVLDDVIHVDTQEEGGILAGSNLRSVLFAVYRFLRLNGCRWLYPGIDGEHIPMQDIAPQKYHKLADHRFRGFCNEGTESQQSMMETIDFYPKLEMNVYMLEFDIPYVYYQRYYEHEFNPTRPAEPVSYNQVLQWKRQCEAEIAKRCLQFHDMGHGWTAEPFGLLSRNGWKQEEDPVLTPEQQEALALTKGVRKFHKGIALNTNVCMSNPKVRATMIRSIVAHAEAYSHVDFLHVWLADGKRNHCECPECQIMRPSDWYLVLMNELDAVLTEKGLPTRIVFIAYVDTMFAPEHITVNNPQRFSLLYAPITRKYTSSITEDTVVPEPSEYIRNAWPIPESAEANLAHLKQWQKTWTGPVFCYEYHFWRRQCRDVALMYMSRRIYEDILGLKYMGVDGIVEDGSQRHHFPNGFAVYIFAEALMNRDCDYDAVMEDYFRHAYGDAWKEVKDYLHTVSEVFDYGWMAGEKRLAPQYSVYYDPARAERLQQVAALAEKARSIAAAHPVMPTRPQAVSMRLLQLHAEYIEGFAACMTEKALGNNEKAVALFEDFCASFGRHEVEIDRYYDHEMAMATLKIDVNRVKPLYDTF